jgi:hypothetical protein
LLRPQHASDASEDLEARDVLGRGLPGREVLPEIAEGQRPEQRIGDRVGGDVGVGMPVEPA